MNPEALLTLAAIVIDCDDPQPLGAVYSSATGRPLTRADGDSAWLALAGSTVVFRKVDGYRAPTWPSDAELTQVGFTSASLPTGRRA